MLAYKLVEKGTRHGTNWTLYKKEAYFPLALSRKEKRELIKKARRKYLKEFKSLLPRYFKNTIVEAHPGSPGIFCFPSIKDAEKFKELYKIIKDHSKIIKVEGIGTPNYNPWLLPACSDPNILVFAYQNINFLLERVRYAKEAMYYNEGIKIVTFPKVKVLE